MPAYAGPARAMMKASESSSRGMIAKSVESGIAVTITPSPRRQLRLSMDGNGGLASRMRDIAPFHVMEVQTAARALEARGRSVIHMEIGEPDFPTPQPVLDAAVAGIADGRLYYTSALGLPTLRRAIATHYRDHYGVEIAPE